MMFAGMPIGKRLTALLLLTSSAALLLACIGFYAYEYFTYRQSTLRQLGMLGEVIATNSTASLAFYNREDAHEVLSALQANSHIVAAALYERDGQLFARYPEQTAIALPERPPREGFRFEGGYLVGVLPVSQGGSAPLGWLYLQSDLGEIYGRFFDYSGIAVVVIMLAMLLAWLLSRRLQKEVSEPILALSRVAEAVSERKDYSRRAPVGNTDELGSLTKAFNHMLDQIQAQMARLELLNRITRAIGERQDIGSIFQVVVRTLEEDFPADFALICLYDPASELLTVAGIGSASSEALPQLSPLENAQIPVGENGLARCVRGQLVYEPDVTEVQFEFPQQLARAGFRAVVFAPLLTESQTSGVLVVARREPHSFSSGDCEFLRQLSQHTALAAHQAQLYGALQQAYDDLRQTQHTVMQQERLRALGQMASGIAHDINNAISPVALYTESLLEREPNLSERARDYLTTIQQAIEDVAETVARMREFYRPREPQLQLVQVDINKLVKQVLDLTRARWSDQPQQEGVMIELVTELATDLPPFMGAEAEIRDALINLIFNAVDAMPRGGRLTVRTSKLVPEPAGANGPPSAPQVQVEVSDTGIGMDEETRRRCLEPFFTTKGERGTGLGLAMVYGTAQRHSAELQIDSEPGRGTTMRLLFPVMMPDFVNTMRLAAPVKPSQRLRVLIVDDDPLLIRSLRDTLEGDGHVVTAADGGEAGIAAFTAAHERQESFSVVVTDLGMPYVDGRKVAAAIKAISPSTPVIMLTGWGQRLVAENDIPEHVDRVLNKPPRLHELRAALFELTSGGSRAAARVQ